MKPIEKHLKYMTLIYYPEKKILYLYGDNKWVQGEIKISWRYFNSVVVIISRIWRKRRWK